MFEKKEPFQWKIPILILTGILVLSGGIYIGVKSRDNIKETTAFKTEEINKEQDNNRSTKDAFSLSTNCEIWLYKRSEEGSLLDSKPSMIGIAPKELMGKTKEEIRTYLSNDNKHKPYELITGYYNISHDTLINNLSDIVDIYTHIIKALQN